VQVRLLLQFFLLLFNKQVLLWVSAVEDFTTIGTLYLKKSYHLRTFTYEAERTFSGPVTQTTEPPEHKPLVVNVVVVGLSKEEEEGAGVTSDVVKVEGKDLDTPGYVRGDRVRLGRQRSRIGGASPFLCFFWFCHHTARAKITQQKNQERTQVVCSNTVARKHPARLIDDCF